MPVAKLFVEGNLESQVLNPILTGTPMLQKGGSKNSLKPRARAERAENRVAAGYLRDRDFDFDPPEDFSLPTVDCEENGIPIGWRWCRHELENYLLEPGMVEEAMGWDVADFSEAICHAGKAIRLYESARWTVGLVRRALPPHFQLQTRPEGLGDIGLPEALDDISATQWAAQAIETHRNRIADAADPSVVSRSLDDFAARFDDAFVSDVSNVLVWFSGKDILAAMSDWLRSRNFANPGAFRARLRDWIIDHPERALEWLPEWRGLIDSLRA
jgi:hypothetical protein